MVKTFYILRITALLTILLIALRGNAQPTVLVNMDTLRTDTATNAAPPAETEHRPDFTDSLISKKHAVIPKKSGLYAAIVPGLGQLYNQQYWKIGVVYAALGTGAGFIIYNNKEYKYWRKIYVGRLSHKPEAMNQEAYLNDNQVKLQQDFYRKNMDVSFLLTGIGYALQIIDAIVFAHLKDFDISPDISMKLKPVMLPQAGVGMGLVVNFK